MSRTHISTGIMSRMRAFESTDSTSTDNSTIAATTAEPGADHCHNIADADRIEYSALQTGRTTTMMMSSPPTGVQTDADGLILPKKLINPCLESTDRKQLHRELKFNNKVGKSVLNQKTELQRAYEKQKERQQQQQQTQTDHSPTAATTAAAAGGIIGLKGELSRVIMERAQKHEHARSQQDTEADDEDKQYVNPEYLNIRAKLRTGQRGELK